MSAGLRSSRAGHGDRQSGERPQPTINEQYVNLLDKTEKMGLVPEIKELSEQVEEVASKLKYKTHELEVLEVLAMESTNENVCELRTQLFTMVKLVHQNEIDQLMKIFENSMGEDSESCGAKPYQMNLMDRARNWIYRRIERHRRAKQIRTDWKNNLRD